MTLTYHLRINQGETFQLAVPVLDSGGDPASLTGATAHGQIRSHAASPTVLYEWAAAAENLAFDGNDVVLTVPAADSAAWGWRTATWSLELIDGSETTTRLVDGHVIIHPEVVR